MKKNDLVQIKGSDLKELRLKAKGFRTEIADLVLDKNMKKIKDLKKISKRRKDLAQVLTVIRQKELLQELEPKLADEDNNKIVVSSTAKSSSSRKTKSTSKKGAK